MGCVKIRKDKCKGCGLCVIYCPNRLIHISKNLNRRGIHAAEAYKTKGTCSGCGMCAIICPDCAIEVYR